MNILLIVYLITFDIITIANICTLLYIFKSLKNQNELKRKKVTSQIRKHPTIKATNYDNSYNTRGYEQFKDRKTGLYEPQKPHGGIELKKQKEA